MDFSIDVGINLRNLGVTKEQLTKVSKLERVIDGGIFEYTTTSSMLVSPFLSSLCVDGLVLEKSKAILEELAPSNGLVSQFLGKSVNKVVASTPDYRTVTSKVSQNPWSALVRQDDKAKAKTFQGILAGVPNGTELVASIHHWGSHLVLKYEHGHFTSAFTVGSWVENVTETLEYYLNQKSFLYLEELRGVSSALVYGTFVVNREGFSTIEYQFRDLLKGSGNPFKSLVLEEVHPSAFEVFDFVADRYFEENFNFSDKRAEHEYLMGLGFEVPLSVPFEWVSDMGVSGLLEVVDDISETFKQSGGRGYSFVSVRFNGYDLHNRYFEFPFLYSTDFKRLDVSEGVIQFVDWRNQLDGVLVPNVVITTPRVSARFEVEGKFYKQFYELRDDESTFERVCSSLNSYLVNEQDLGVSTQRGVVPRVPLSSPLVLLGLGVEPLDKFQFTCGSMGIYPVKDGSPYLIGYSLGDLVGGV